VSIEPPDGLLLEIKPSIPLFGGLRELCRQLRDACRADPVLAQTKVQPRFTLAPTALAALAAARAGARCFITDPNVLAARLKPLPLATLRGALQRTPDVASVSPPGLNPAGDTAVITAYPRSSPQSERTTQLVKHLRNDVIPPIAQRTHAAVYVGGTTAIFIDFSSVLSSKL
jgi:hypothetical protein